MKEIDGSRVVFEDILKDRYDKNIVSDNISTGCKTLLCIRFLDSLGLVWNGSAMGDNCYPFLLELCEDRDITVFLEHYPYIDSKYFIEGLIGYSGRPLSEIEFDDLYADWCEKCTKYWEEHGKGDGFRV